MRIDAPGSVRIQRGQLMIYRVFDVAEEINLTRAETILQRLLEQSRVTLDRRIRQTLTMRAAPIRIGLGETQLVVPSRTLDAGTFATIWDYGVISILFRIPLPSGSSWEELVRLADLVNNNTEANSILDAAARLKSVELTRILAPTLTRPSDREIVEDYVLWFFEDLGGTPASKLTEAADIPSLLLGETQDVLAPQSRAGILENSFQYGVDDLAVIDWNSAVVVEPSGLRAVPDILEFALTHLLEFRYYDDLLDARLADLYDAVEARRRGIWRSRFAHLSREANARFMEFSEFMERIDNSLKIVGDFYLATIFRAAVRRFRIPDWQQSITRKINLLARVSELLQGEVNVMRGHTMELVIVILILFELVSALVKIH